MGIIIPGLCVGSENLEKSRPLPQEGLSRPNVGIQKNHLPEMHCFPLWFMDENNQIQTPKLLEMPTMKCRKMQMPEIVNLLDSLIDLSTHLSHK